MIRYQLTAADAQVPVRKTRKAAGYDVFAQLTDDYPLKSGRTVKLGRTLSFRDGTKNNTEYRLCATAPPLFPDRWSVTLHPGQRCLVPMGFRAQVPDHLYAAVVPRSGEPWNHGVVVKNAPGTIDADFKHEWMVMLENPTKVPYEITQHLRVCQLVLLRYEVEEWVDAPLDVATGEEVGRTGFGSTGR